MFVNSSEIVTVSTCRTRCRDHFEGSGISPLRRSSIPGKAAEVQHAIEAAAAKLRDGPVSADILERARNPVIEGADHALRDNGYWLSALEQAQSDPARLEQDSAETSHSFVGYSRRHPEARSEISGRQPIAKSPDRQR